MALQGVRLSLSFLPPVPCILESIIPTIAVLASWEKEFRPMIPMESPNNWTAPCLPKCKLQQKKIKKKSGCLQVRACVDPLPYSH